MRSTACLLIPLFLIGCVNKGKVPSGIIPQPEMSGIIWDMVQADQYSDYYLVKDSAHINVKMETLKLYQEVFQLHRVSLDEFRESFRFYLNHPDMMRGVFDTVLTRGNTQRSNIYKDQINGPPKAKTTPPVFKPVNGKPAGIAPAVPAPSPHGFLPPGRGAGIPVVPHPGQGAGVPAPHTPGSGQPGKPVHVFPKPGRFHANS
jgi:hypothetical protein